MYRDRSNQSGDISEMTVYLDMIKRGWMVSLPSSRDAVYDLVVDMGEAGYQTIQVKTMLKNSITKVIDRSGERVSANGKVRNSLDYAAHGIDWLAGVSASGDIYYYKLKTYSGIKTKTFSVKKYKPDNFPVNEVPSRHTVRKTK